MPGEESRLRQQYYARANNDFWKIVGECLGVTLHGLAYERKTALLLAHGVGLWDVYQHCDRTGSADSTIANAALNDFAGLRREYPSVRWLLLNGKEAASQDRVLRALGFEVVALPSTSGANRRDMTGRLNQWRAALQKATLGKERSS